MGFTDRAKIDADANVKMAEQNRQKQIELANIAAQRDQALKSAEVDIERQRVAGIISTEQAQTARAQFQASVDAWANTQMNTVNQQYETQRSALLDQTNLGLESIREVGKTERWNIAWSTGLSALVLILIVVLGWLMMRFRLQSARLYINGPQYHRLGSPYNEKQIVDGQFYAPVKEVNHEY